MYALPRAAHCLPKLGESQTEELIPTGETADFVVAAMAGDATLELLGMNQSSS